MYKKYVELKEKKGVTDYKVSKETGPQPDCQSTPNAKGTHVSSA